MKRPAPYLLLLLLIVACFSLAATLQPRVSAWTDQDNSGNVLKVLLGDGRRIFANHAFVQADVYFHSGYYPSVFDQNQAPKDSHHMTAVEGSTEAEEHEKKMNFLGPPKDWLERFGRHFMIVEHTHLEGATLVSLHALQEAFGYVPEAAVPMIADALNLSRAEVHGVVTFYHDFRREPAGRHVLKLCRAEACQAAGGDALAARAEARLGIAMGTTAPDGSVTLEPVYCLGLCAAAPSAMVDGAVVGRLDEQRLDAVLAQAQR